MPRRDFTLDLRNTDEANFRTVGRTISDALVACGLTRSNAINWDTVVRPTAGSFPTTHRETFAFGGTLQADYPLFLDLYYGVGGVNTIFGYQVRGGSARTQDTQGQEQLVLGENSASGAANQDVAQCHIASDGQNWLTIVLGANVAANLNTLGVLSIERLRDGAGAYTRGVYSCQGGRNVNPVSRFNLLTTQVAGVSALGSVPAWVYGATLFQGAVGLLPHILPIPGQPPTVILYGSGPEWGTGEEVTVEGRTYRLLQAATHSGGSIAVSTSNPVATSSGTNMRHAVRVA